MRLRCGIRTSTAHVPGGHCSTPRRRITTIRCDARLCSVRSLGTAAKARDCGRNADDGVSDVESSSLVWIVMPVEAAVRVCAAHLPCPSRAGCRSGLPQLISATGGPRRGSPAREHAAMRACGHRAGENLPVRTWASLRLATHSRRLAHPHLAPTTGPPPSGGSFRPVYAPR